MELDLLAAQLDLPDPRRALGGGHMCDVVAYGSPPHGAVLRRAPGSSHEDRTRFDFCRSLYDAGVAMPEPRSFHSSATSTVTHWELLDASGPVDWRSAGRALASLHRCGLVPPVSLRWMASPSEVLDHADAALARDTLSPNTVELLVSLWRQGVDVWSRDALVPCHGDAWPRNMVFTPRGAVFVDWDTVCGAPAVFDLALMVAGRPWPTASVLGDHGFVDLDAFADGYGADLPSPADALTVVAAHEAALVLSWGAHGVHPDWVTRVVARLAGD